MNGPVFAIKIKPVIRQVGDDPPGNFFHVFVFDDEIHRRAQARANGFAFAVEFASGMLVQLGGDAAFDVLGQRGRGEAIGQLNRAIIINCRVENIGSKFIERRIAVWLLGKIVQSGLGLGFTALN